MKRSSADGCAVVAVTEGPVSGVRGLRGPSGGPPGSAAALRLVGGASEESPPRPGRLGFGPFEFDPATGELWRDGTPVHLQQQPARVLALLAMHPGVLLTREQIRRHVWGDGTFVDFQRGLNFAVMQVRTALGDAAESPRYVETLARRGYRFVAPLTADGRPGTPAEVTEVPAERTVESPTPRRLPRRPGLRRGVVALGLGLGILAGALWWSAAPAPASARKMIAVVPFRNLGPPEDQFFADGITDEVTSRLATISGLGVISPTSTRQYSGGAKPISQIGAGLGVEYVLEGSVRWQRTGPGSPRVRITPRLVRASDEVQLWSRTWERDTAEVFRLQSDLALDVARELDVGLRVWEQGELERVPTASPDAYEAYLRGLSAQARYAPPDTRVAIGLFERAVELDPGFALAWAELSYSHSLLYHHEPPDAEAQVAPARMAAEKALALAPGSARGHLALGYYHYWCHKDYARALDEFALAERTAPGDARLLQLVGAIRRRQGRLDEALAREEQALALNPRDARAAWNLGSTYAMVGRFEDADRSWERAIALAPDLTATYRTWAALLVRRGDMDGARRTLRRAPGPLPPLSAAWIEYYAGDYEAALRYLVEAPAGRPDPYVMPTELLRALALEAMGRRPEAQAAYRAARTVLEHEIDGFPADAWAHAELGLTLAALGHKQEALAEGQRAAALIPMSSDAVDGPGIVIDVACIQSLVGEHEAALDSIERVRALPHASSVLPASFLVAEPAFRALRDHPRFRQLVERAHSAAPAASPTPPGARPPGVDMSPWGGR